MYETMYNRSPIYGAYSQPQPFAYAAGIYNRPVSGNQITWVMGIENAKTFPIAPNTTVLLMDSEAPKFYIKTSDANGMCNLETYKFEKFVDAMTKPAEPASPDYVTRAEFEAAIAQLVAAKQAPAQTSTPTEPRPTLF